MRALNIKLLWTGASLVVFATRVLAQGDLPPAPTPPAASEAGSNPVPFASAAPTETDLNSALQLSESGRLALENGFVSVAVYSFKQALAIPNLNSATTDSLNLDLVTAYLSEDQLNEASAALQLVKDTSTPAYLLRSVLLKSRQGQWDGADGVAAQLARIDSNQLSAADLPWYYTVQARLAEHQDNADAAQAAWKQAIDHAPALLKGQFQAAQWDSQVLLSKTPTAGDVDKLHDEMVAASTPSLGAQFASAYAIGLDQLGRHDDALKVVADWVGKTDLDHKNRDTLRLLWVYLDNKGPAPADPTLKPDALALLEAILQEPIDINSPDRDAIRQMQAQALGLLEQKTFGEKPEGAPAGTDPASLEKFVDGIIADPDADSHPLLKQLYLFKARLALMLNQTDIAGTAASELLEKYPPGTGPDPYVTDAEMVLAQVDWHDGQPGGQPRLAISNLLKVYDSLPSGEQAPVERSLAYLYFMNGDYHNAADFYTKLLQHPGADSPISTGDLLLRAVESDRLAGQLDAAVKIMDDPASLVDVTPDDRWRAEWNLLIALRDQNPDAAFQRLDRLLDPSHGANLLRPDLYLRLLWLHAFLAVGRSEPEAGAMVEVLQKVVNSYTPEVVAGLPPDERTNLADLLPQLQAQGLLLQGEAEGQAQQFDQQHKTFELLRQSHAGTDPALNSYIIEASVLEGQNKLVDAKQLMNTVSDNFSNAKQAPYALYMSAVYSGRLGKTQEALNLLQKFVEKYQNDPVQRSLLSKVRLTQAFLEGKKDTQVGWENARDIYGELIKTLNPGDVNLVSAKVGRAVSLWELATLPEADAQRRLDAMAELNGLYNQPNLPVDDRVEMGWMNGNLLENGGKPDPDAAAAVYLQIVNDFLLKDKAAAELDNSTSGRFWMQKCLTSLKRIFENEKNDTEARNVDNLIEKYNLSPPASPAPASSSPSSPVAAPAQTTTN